MKTIRRLISCSCLAVLLAGGAAVVNAQAVRSTGNGTPRSKVCLIFSPQHFEIGEGGEEYTNTTMEQQDYDVKVRVNKTLNNTPTAKLTHLTGTACGIRFIFAHACATALEAEACADEVKRDEAYENYKQSGFTDDDIYKRWHMNGDTKYYVIGIRASGLARAKVKAMDDANGTVTFCAGCLSFGLRDAFGGREYFGYDLLMDCVKSQHDAKVLWDYMSGVKDSGNSRPAGRAYAKGLPWAPDNDDKFMDGTVHYNRKLCHHSSAGGKTTLCPVVADRFPKNGVWSGCIGYIRFDTAMDGHWDDEAIQAPGLTFSKVW